MRSDDRRPPNEKYEKLHKDLASDREARRITGPEAGTYAEGSHDLSADKGASEAPLPRYLRNRGRHKTSTEMRTALRMTNRLTIELEQMIEEHEVAVTKLRKLSERYARLARKMK